MKKTLFFLLLAIIIIGGYFYFKDANSKLLAVGYLPHDIKEIEKKLNDEEISLLLKYEKLSYITDLINHTDYDSQKLEEYIIEKEKKPELDIDEIIVLVNKNINSENPIISDLMKESYFIKDKLERYLQFYEKNQQRKINEIISMVNSNVDYGFYEHDIITDLEKDTLMLVNKFYQLPSNYEPSDLVDIKSTHGTWGKLRKEAYEQFIKMHDDALKENIKLKILSPYREYDRQKRIYENYVKRDGKVAADTYSARPGHSEHQTGLSIDLNLIEDAFKNTSEYKWLKDNAHRYGYILRYPEGLEYITGYKFEPWHYRYVGVDTATEIYNLDITFDEYYAFFIE